MARTIFIQGALPTDLLVSFTQQYSADMAAGAYSCFMGQVRADKKENHEVRAIEFTAYAEMADIQIQDIMQQVQQQYKLNGLEVRHSLGKVNAGELCLFVLTIAGHRKAAMEACNVLVERLKSELPIWGKEIFSDEEYQWKINQ